MTWRSLCWTRPTGTILWPLHAALQPLAELRYQRHPYRDMFGVDAYELDAGLDLLLRLEQEPLDFPARFASIQADLLFQSRTGCCGDAVQ